MLQRVQEELQEATKWRAEAEDTGEADMILECKEAEETLRVCSLRHPFIAASAARK